MPVLAPVAPSGGDTPLFSVFAAAALPPGSTFSDPIDCEGYRSAAVGVVCTGSPGSHTRDVQGSLDGVQWFTLFRNDTSATALLQITFATPTASMQIFEIGGMKWLRVRHINNDAGNQTVSAQVGLIS